MAPTPETSSKWLGVLLPVLREGGPIVSLVLLILGGCTVYWLTHALTKSQERSMLLHEKLLTCYQAQVQLAKTCQPSPP